MSRAIQLTCVAIGGRGLLIDGPSGSGKSSLALALIDRGAVLVGDDGVMIAERSGQLLVSPHPNTIGKLEVRNLGILDFPTAPPVPAALFVRLSDRAPRYVDQPEWIEIENVRLPRLRFWPGSPVLALRAELALSQYGLPLS